MTACALAEPSLEIDRERLGLRTHDEVKETIADRYDGENARALQRVGVDPGLLLDGDAHSGRRAGE